MLNALRDSGCRIITEPSADRAPFRFTFETPTGERLGVVAYAFLANSKVTKNRPSDEHRFQIKYGSKSDQLHELWQDPFGLYITLLLGINPDAGFFVAADPVIHSPTRFFISLEFKQTEVEEILRSGWHAWERERRSTPAAYEPAEVLVGGTASSFLRYVQFERECLGEDQGHRQLIAEKFPLAVYSSAVDLRDRAPMPNHIHELVREFEMSESDVMDLIAGARRLKMAVRGWVAVSLLVQRLQAVEGVTECRRIDDEGGPDVELRYRNSRTITIECKNVLRKRMADGTIRLDFQRTRASTSDRCSRYYSAQDFDVVAACVHAVTERWDYHLVRTVEMEPHPVCAGKLSQNVRLDQRWSSSIEDVLGRVVNT